MRILVTGGAGYIGSHVCKALAESGFEPVTFDSLIRGNRWAVKYGPFFLGDLLDEQALVEVFKKYSPSAVIHLAAFAYVGESIASPGKYYKNNVTGLLCLLDAMKKSGVNQLVFSSSCATYGVPSTVPIKEDSAQSPINPYGFSKLFCERILLDYDLTKEIRSISLRYFNVAGADPEGEIGEWHRPETHLVPLALEASRVLGSSITINGIDYETVDGTCIRDFIHVTDLSRAHILALQALLSGATTNSYNVSNERGFSVLEIIRGCERFTGRKIPFIYGPRRLGDPAILIGDSTKIKNELGWKAEFSSLDTILSTACKWYSNAEKQFT